MSDNRNPSPEREPADGDQPAGPPEPPAGDDQSPRWWSGSADAKREFQDPSAGQGERRADNWFGAGWSDRRPDESDQTPAWQTQPEQSRPAQGDREQSRPEHGGPVQSGPTQSSPVQGGPTQRRPQSAPPYGSPAQTPPRQGGSPAGPSGTGPVGWQSAPSYGSTPQPTPPQGPSSESSYLWAPTPPPGQAQQPQSPWSNALPPSQRPGGPRPATQHSQHGPGYNQGAQQGPGYNQGAQQGPGFGQGGGQLGPMGQPVQQAPTWQYPPIPIPQPPGPGRRRKQKRRARGLLIGLVVLAVLVVGSGVTLLVRMTGDDAPQTTDSPSVAPSETPSASPSASPSTTPSEPAPPAEDEVLTANKLYAVGPIAASKCAEPPFAPINFTAARAYYNRLLPCLNRTWSMAMKKAGLRFRSPKAVVYAGKLSSPCGMQRSVRATYCGANSTIYLPFAVDNRYYRNNPVYARAIMLNTFAHEYGHHVQNLSGILAASVERQQTMTPNQKLLESRRRELQATCLGAAYLGANAAFTPMRNPLLANWRFLIAHTGDDYARPRVHDHGNRVSNYKWSIAGYHGKKPNSCNTFTADEARVA